MRLFELHHLSDKSSRDTIKILSISFEYLMAGIANEHSKLLAIPTDSTKQFNQFNRLDWFILTSYPFFVSMANGNSKSLFALFGDFYATQSGPISMSVYGLMESVENDGFARPFHYFKNPKGENVGSVQSLDPAKSLSSIMQELKEEVLTLEDGESVSFKNVMISSDSEGQQKALSSAIDSSINVIQRQSRGTFFDGDPRTVNYQSTFFKTFHDPLKEDEAREITYFDPRKESPFFDEVAF